jgi:hypothetical protein
LKYLLDISLLSLDMQAAAENAAENAKSAPPRRLTPGEGFFAADNQLADRDSGQNLSDSNGGLWQRKPPLSASRRLNKSFHNSFSACLLRREMDLILASGQLAFCHVYRCIVYRSGDLSNRSKFPTSHHGLHAVFAHIFDSHVGTFPCVKREIAA